MSKKFLLNADDFGLSDFHNKAVFEGYKSCLLKSASICVNTNSFYDAAKNIVPLCEKLAIGVHLNIMEGKSVTNCYLLTDKNGYFNKSYIYLILNQNNKKLLQEVENEFRAQIEKALKYNLKIVHLDSHVHVHAIPEIFKIVCKLAKEYNIEYLRTQNEVPYIVKNTKLNKYLINFIKIMLLKYFTYKNKKILKKYNLKTNDYIIGIGYSGMMSSNAVIKGLKALQNPQIVEAIIHPCKYEKKDSHLQEFYITQDLTLKKEIENLGFIFADYKSF